MDELGIKFKEIGMRLVVWGTVIGISLCIWGICKFFVWLFAPNPEVYINYDVNDIQDFNSVSNVGVNSYSVIYNKSEEPVAIIGKENQEIDGFVEKNKSIFSPLVMYVNDKAIETNSGFSVFDTNLANSSIKVQKNLSSILEGIEQDKTWQDIGINKDVLEGPIKLAVPDKHSPYREQIKDLFVINLAENEITVDNYSELMARADSILEKCIQVEDPKSYLSINKTEDDVAQKIAVIAPEYIMNYDNDKLFYCACESDNPVTFVPVYLTKTTAINYSLYIKEDIDKELEESIIDSYNGSGISKKTGYRNINTNAKYISGYHIVPNINIEYIPEKIKEGVEN